MKLLIHATVLAITLASTVEAQRQSKPRQPSRQRQANTQAPVAPMVGSAVQITTRNGGQITGTLAGLDIHNVRIKQNNLESTVALEAVTSISFRPASGPAQGQHQKEKGSRVRPEFAQDVGEISTAFRTIAETTQSGADYTDYGRELTELRRTVEKYVCKYAGSEETTESRVAALAAGALVDYTWARVLWTLKLGYSASAVVTEADSPTIADALSLYPELRETAASGAKLSVDKLVAGLWKQASAKAERLRAATGEMRSEAK